jgi:serine/threonine-protein kinase
MLRVSQRLLFVLALVPAAAFGAEYFGAIAYSQGKRAHGWGKDYPSRQQAEKAALANCARFAGDCGVVVWFKNACGALSLGPKGAGWAWAHKQEDADLAAMRACSKHSKACTVTQRLCTKR